MALYLVRVELPGTAERDYAGLHRAMFDESFFTILRSDDGRWWHLPHATYQATGGVRATTEVELDLVLSIAERFHRNPRVLVSQWSECSFKGLRLVSPQDPVPDYYPSLI